MLSLPPPPPSGPSNCTFVPIKTMPSPSTSLSLDEISPMPRLSLNMRFPSATARPKLAIKRRSNHGSVLPLLKTAPRVPDALDRDDTLRALSDLPSCRLRMRPSKVARTPTRQAVTSFVANPPTRRLQEAPVQDTAPPRPSLPAHLMLPDIPSSRKRSSSGLPVFRLKPKPSRMVADAA